MPAPAQRIVSLAPHVTELLYAAGAGGKIVGTVEYSDYPPQAKALPRVGDNQRLDLERILALHPDLIVVWLHGSAQRQLEQLRRLGIPMFYSEPKKLGRHRPGDRGAGTPRRHRSRRRQAARQYRRAPGRADRAANAGKAPNCGCFSRSGTSR